MLDSVGSIQPENHVLDMFPKRLMDILDHGGLTFLLSLGHRTGLFDTMTLLPPSRAEEIAEAADLDTHYVHEWLYAMVAAGIVRCDSSGPRYELPASHALFLSRTGKSLNAGALARLVSALSSLEDQAVEAFRGDAAMSDALTFRMRGVLNDIAGSPEERWPRALAPVLGNLRRGLAKGMDVLSLAEDGRPLRWLAETFPQSRFLGLDNNPVSVMLAQQTARDRGLQHLAYQMVPDSNWQAALERLPRHSFDVVAAFDILGTWPQPRKSLRQIARLLSPGGWLVIREVAGFDELSGERPTPLLSLLFAYSCGYGMPMGHNDDRLGGGIAWNCGGTIRLLKELGFSSIDVHRAEEDPLHYYFTARWF